jgi:hypothetical protein
MRVSVVILATLVGMSACKSERNSGALIPSWAAVLPSQNAAAVGQPCGPPLHAAEGIWSPTQEDISRLERELDRVLEKSLARSALPDSLRPAVTDYYRQYAGVVVNGKRLINVTGFHRQYLAAVQRLNADTTAWRTQPVLFCDGGEFYFGATYDPSDGHFITFQFNGYA